MDDEMRRKEELLNELLQKQAEVTIFIYHPSHQLIPVFPRIFQPSFFPFLQKMHEEWCDHPSLPSLLFASIIQPHLPPPMLVSCQDAT